VDFVGRGNTKEGGVYQEGGDPRRNLEGGREDRKRKCARGGGETFKKKMKKAREVGPRSNEKG